MRTEEAWVREVGALLLCTGEACTMGSDLSEALTRMQALESLAQMALFTEILQKNGASGGTRMPEDLLRTLYSDAQK